jgi:hypothetical protein
MKDMWDLTDKLLATRTKDQEKISDLEGILWESEVELKALKAVQSHTTQLPARNKDGVQLTVPSYLIAMDFAEYALARATSVENLSNLWSTYFEDCAKRAAQNPQ